MAEESAAGLDDPGRGGSGPEKAGVSGEDEDPSPSEHGRGGTSRSRLGGRRKVSWPVGEHSEARTAARRRSLFSADHRTACGMGACSGRPLMMQRVLSKASESS